VVCQGNDGVHTAGQCQFKVSLIAAVPMLRFTKFMAFGDSITAGEVNDDTGSCVAHDPFTTQSLPWPRPFRVQPDIAYPKDLERLLVARYTTQTPVVVNEGLGADSTSDGVPRFASALRADNPQVVLILQGVIDIAEHGFRAAPIVSFNLNADIEEARRRGVQAVFLSTLLPTRAPEGLFRGCYATIPEIEAVNTEIRQLAARDGVTLVDSYAAFSGRVSSLIGSDGLHPTAEGMQVIADTFFEAIKEKIEVVAEPARRNSFARRAAADRD
jgi:lysophospholipase L1-like esterase